MVYLMIFIYGLILFYNIVYKKRWINTVFFTMAPYAVITFLNNVFMTRLGYLAVSNEVILLIIAALIPLSLGTGLFRITNKSFNHEAVKSVVGLNKSEKKYLFEDKINDSIDSITAFVILGSFVRLVQLYNVYMRYGLSTIARSDFLEFGLQGFFSHLFLTVYPLFAIVLYFGIEHKSLMHIIVFFMGMGVAALSFIKYHSILLVLFAYFYCVVRDKKLAKKLGIICVCAVVVLFIGNYIVGFAVRGITSYTMKDYFMRLWDYIGGSLINSNYSITEAGVQNYSWKDLLFASITPVINMFCRKLFGFFLNIKYFPLGFKIINYNGTTSNVMSLIFVNLYTGSWVYFVLYLFVLGFVIEWIIYKIETRKNDNRLTFYVMLLTVNILTFFANYFELSAIWEIITWSLVIPLILLNLKIKLKLRFSKSSS